MHIIRLRGPWQLEPLARYVERPGGYEPTQADLPAGGKATMPADWTSICGPDFLGVVRFRRNFQTPTGLGPATKVWLVVEPPRSHATVRLAERPLGDVRAGGPIGRFDVTWLLAEHNQLEIVVAHPELEYEGRPAAGVIDFPGGLVGEVRLEIEESGVRSQEPGNE